MLVGKYLVKGSLLALFATLAGCATVEVEPTQSKSTYAGIDRFNEQSDFVSAVRRADIESANGFAFRVSYFESDYKKYLKAPFPSVFKIYVETTPKLAGADLQFVMCSATEICVQELRGGGASAELYRTEIAFSEGSLDFIIPSELIYRESDAAGNDVLIWSKMFIDNSLWRVTLSNPKNAVEVPSWPEKRIPPKYIRYRNFLEIL